MHLDKATKEPYGLIYKITNTADFKIYIGQTTRLRSFKSYFGSGKYIKRAVEKYGKEVFVKDVLHCAFSKEELDTLEQSEIEAHNSYSPFGYNIKEGGSHGTHTLETRELISRKNKGKTKGIPHAPHVVARRAASMKGRLSPNKGITMTEAQKVKIATALKGKPKSEKHRAAMKGSKILSSENRLKISLRRKGKGIFREVSTGLFHSLELTDSRIKLGEFVGSTKGLGGWKQKPRTAEHSRKLSEGLKGKVKGYIWAKDIATGKKTRMSPADPRWAVGSFIKCSART